MAELDEDADGMVTYDELTDVIRRKLRKGSSKMSENSIKALWCTLDADDSNAIQKDEMAAFLKRGAPAVRKSDKPKAVAKDHTSVNLVGAMERHGMGSAIASMPTSEMKKELEAAGVVLPSPAEQIAYSKQFNLWLKNARDEGNKATHSWFNLFKEASARCRTATSLAASTTAAAAANRSATTFH